MKRDMELVRNILLAVEQRPMLQTAPKLDFPEYSPEAVSYHVMLLHQAGLMEAYDASCDNDLVWIPRWLTWSGHEFLDASRDDGRWRKALSVAKEKAGALSFELLKELLVRLMTEAISKGTGT